MLRTKSVKLTVIPAMAFRIKSADGPSITIQRADYEAAGIASISRTSGEPIPSANTNMKMYPVEAFKEAIEKTNGLPYKRGKGVKVDKKDFKEKKVKPVEEVIIDSDEYQKVVDHLMPAFFTKNSSVCEIFFHREKDDRRRNDGRKVTQLHLLQQDPQHHRQRQAVR